MTLEVIFKQTKKQWFYTQNLLALWTSLWKNAIYSPNLHWLKSWLDKHMEMKFLKDYKIRRATYSSETPLSWK